MSDDEINSLLKKMLPGGERGVTSSGEDQKRQLLTRLL